MQNKVNMRWNGWGLEDVQLPLFPAVKQTLNQELGQGISGKSTLLNHVLQQIPESRLPDHALLDKTPWSRLLHARGQSLQDWAQLRFGQVDSFPDGLARPESEAQLQELLVWALKNQVLLIPYGGGTSVLGHINPLQDNRPVLTVSLASMNKLLDLQQKNRLARFQTGILGPALEHELRNRGYTLGHYPQSFEFSSLGGWISTRSSGQQSLGYGRIEDMFQGGTLHSPAGELYIPSIPASAAGPDLRHIILGSEGRLGLLSSAYLRISPLPEKEDFLGFVLPDFQTGLKAVQELATERCALSMLRLSNARETRINFLLSGKQKLSRLLQKYIRMRGIGPEGCMLLTGFSGSEPRVRHSKRLAWSILNCLGAKPLYGSGRAWAKNRFRAPYLRNTLWDSGYAVDTLETATNWEQVPRLLEAIEDSLQNALQDEQEKVYAFSHLSHFYPTGCSIYCTYIFRVAWDLEVTIRRWKKLKQAASQCIIRHQATISHHHGIGQDHLSFLRPEKSALGLDILRSLCAQLDPQGIMNPGKLVD